MNFAPAWFSNFLTHCNTLLYNAVKASFIASFLANSVIAQTQDNQYESLITITNAVKTELEDLYTASTSYSEIKVEVKNLDSRLRLLRCNDPWHVKIPSDLSGGRISVSVECQTNQNWQVFVTANVKLMMKVIVANHSLQRGEILMENDVKESLMDLSSLRQGYLINKQNAVGYELKRNISLGDPLRQQILAMPMVISRGEIVSISAVSAAISVEASGTALANGRIGEHIRVKNNRSGRIVQAKVTGAGQVEIAL